MLGKRSWAVRRTTSISNMNSMCSTGSPSCQPQPKDRWPSRSTPPSTPPSSVLRQVIGFNPTPRNDSDKTATGPISSFPADGKICMQGIPSKSHRPPISPRSALQSLLAAARQGEEGKESKSCALSYTLEEKSATGDKGDVGMIQGRNEIGSTLAQSIVQKTFISSTLKRSPPEHHAEATACVLDIKETPWMNISVQSSRDGHEGVETNRVQEAFDSQGLEFNCQETERQRPHSRQFLFVATSPIMDPSMLTPSIDFLDACYLCKRRLGQGRDIFMYRGDKAFCSVECRYQQIVIDEGKEKHSPSLLRSGSAAPARHARQRRSILPAGTAAVR